MTGGMLRAWVLLLALSACGDKGGGGILGGLISSAFAARGILPDPHYRYRGEAPESRATLVRDDS